MKIPPRSRQSHAADDHSHEGLGNDLLRLASIMSRRKMLGLIAGASLLPVFGCGSDGATASGSCTQIPEETAGPFPGDGTNGKNALTLADIVRSDIRASIGGPTGVATGVVLTVKLTIVDTSNGCAPLPNHAVYIWHCDAGGNYSMYSSSVVGETYLRGVQVTDANGQVSFTTVYPGCYSGRWPHIHFEVYETLAKATNGGNAIATSQMALPKATDDLVYATSGYSASVGNLSKVTLSTDNVFSDGATTQLGNMSGDTVGGFTAALTVGV